jgi:hypothetical protein
MTITSPALSSAPTTNPVPSQDDGFSASIAQARAGTNADDVKPESGAEGITLFGGSQNDRMSGSNGDDLLFGDIGDDQLEGNLGDDTIFGGVGSDTILGGPGTDDMYDTLDLDRNERFDIDGGSSKDAQEASHQDRLTLLVSGAGDNPSFVVVPQQTAQGPEALYNLQVLGGMHDGEIVGTFGGIEALSVNRQELDIPQN